MIHIVNIETHYYNVLLVSGIACSLSFRVATYQSSISLLLNVLLSLYNCGGVVTHKIST
jgi:hypothetical protein